MWSKSGVGNDLCESKKYANERLLSVGRPTPTQRWRSSARSSRFSRACRSSSAPRFKPTTSRTSQSAKESCGFWTLLPHRKEKCDFFFSRAEKPLSCALCSLQTCDRGGARGAAAAAVARRGRGARARGRTAARLKKHKNKHDFFNFY